MERAGPTPPGAVRPADLVALAERAGPFATVWVGRSGLGTWGERADDAAETTVRSALEKANAPDPVVHAVSEALAGVSADAHGAVVVADEGGNVLVEELPREPRQEWVAWAPLPSVAPVLENRQAGVPMLVVLADRTGADILISGSSGETATTTVEGAEHPISTSAPGGWSQKRYQQRAEDSWEHNAKDVAQEIRSLAADMFPDLLVLGGDERAVELILEEMPKELRQVSRVVSSGRAADGSGDQRDDHVERLGRAVVAEETMELLQTFEQEDGRRARATNGAVDVLLVHDDGDDDDRVAWFTTDPGIVAMDRAELEALGYDQPTAGRLIDVAINAALRTGGAVRVVPDAATLDGGLGAILRWSDGQEQ
jgi:hypothetical protein